MRSKNSLCSRCKLSKKPVNDTYCPPCRRTYGDEWRAKNLLRIRARDAKRRRENPDKTRDSQLRYAYGITLKDEKSLYDKQDGKCAICRNTETAKGNGKPKRLAVDHSRISGAVRGLLCQRCNQALGLIKESFDSAINLAKYIQEHNNIL